MVPGSIHVASVVWSRVLTEDLVRVSSSQEQLQEGVQGEAPRRQAGLRGKRLAPVPFAPASVQCSFELLLRDGFHCESIRCPDLVWVGRIADWQGRW